MTPFLRKFLAAVTGAISLFLFADIAFVSRSISTYLAVSEDTDALTKTSELYGAQLAGTFVLLIVFLFLTWALLPPKRKMGLTLLDAALILVAPIATTSLSFLVGTYAEILAFWICILGIVLRSRRLKYVRPIASTSSEI